MRLRRCAFRAGKARKKTSRRGEVEWNVLLETEEVMVGATSTGHRARIRRKVRLWGVVLDGDRAFSDVVCWDDDGNERITKDPRVVEACRC